MMQSPYRALQEHFGLNEFRTSQLEIIEHILAGNNTLATLP
ncbi:MAG: superfamily II DNA helicase RecQ, partial [Rubritalea sp.]